MIPKVIHYCWFGNKEKPQLVQDCIASWRRLMPKYEIMEWNENNSPMDIPFVIQAYNAEKWAFVSDYVRSYVLFQYGGIYLDTDMLMFQSLDDFLSYKFFIGKETPSRLSCGVMGSVSNYILFDKLLSYYQESDFLNCYQRTIPDIITDFCLEHRIFNGVDSCSSSVLIAPLEYFYDYTYEQALDGVDPYKVKHPLAYGAHLWNHSWKNEISYMKERNYKKVISCMLNTHINTGLQPVKYYRDLLWLFRNADKN